MATTKINVTAVIAAGTSISNAKKNVGNVKSSYNSTRKNIDGAILNRNNLRSNFNNVANRLVNLETYISQIKTTVDNSANKYYNTDRRIVNEFNSKNNRLKTSTGKSSTAMFGNAAAFITDVKKIDKKKSSNSQNSTSTSTTKKKDEKKEKKMDWWSWGDTWDFVGEFGNVGAVVSGIGGVITEEDKWKKALGGAKTIVGIAGKGFGELAERAAKTSEKLAKNVSKSSFDWKKLVGFNMEDTKHFGESIKETIDDYNFGNAKGGWEKLKVGAKWAGSILTIGTTAYDNFTDKEEKNSTGRKIAETIGESTVKIAGGALVGAAVTAGAALIGVTSAPVVVTGAVTVAATWAINKGFEYITGKDAAECISDTVLDIGTAVGKGIGKAAKKAGSTVAKWCKGLFK